ncbi:unnamed protein product [Rotaria magnacalcarata]|uniref:Uncharacterized protein n=1 Tax=Rotaria magnacalcarata TaxID=392030 RepID=A0A819HJL9_9BILA|nr:unnamed protein product [Rotaria magnacalcarata]
MLSALIFRSTSNYLFVNPSIKQLFHSFNSINAPLSVKQPLIDPNPPLVGQAIEIKEFLRQNSISFDESWTCIKALCCRSTNKPSGFIHIGKERGDFACLKCATSGTWEDFKSQLQNLRSRTFCPKASLPLILLPDEERDIWGKSKAIADCDKDVLDITLSRYGFNEEYTLSTDTLQRYGLRIYQDQLIAPLYDADRSLVNIVVLDPICQTNTKPLKLTVPFGLNLLSARNAEIMLLPLFFAYKILPVTMILLFGKDYQELNDTRLSELEKSYKAKLDLVRNEISKREKQQETAKPQDIRIALDSMKQEHRTSIEQNQLLKDKSEQLENDLRNVTEQNRQRYQTVDREYQKLQRELPELDCIVVHLRENAGSLWSEINTYRYLLVNLLPSPNDKPQKSSGPCSPPLAKASTKTMENKNQESKISKSMVKPMINPVTKPTVDAKAKSPQQYRDETTGFIVHIEDGIIWVRI